MSNKSSSESITIRQAEISDFEIIFDLLKQLWPNWYLDKEIVSETYQSMYNSQDHILLCAMNSDQVVGFGTLSIKKSLYAQGNLAHIDELVIDEKHRSKGIGNRLLEDLTQIAIQRSCTLIELDSALYRDQAHRFYEREGFSKTA